LKGRHLINPGEALGHWASQAIISLLPNDIQHKCATQQRNNQGSLAGNTIITSFACPAG